MSQIAWLLQQQIPQEGENGSNVFAYAMGTHFKFRWWAGSESIYRLRVAETSETSEVKSLRRVGRACLSLLTVSRAFIKHDNPRVPSDSLGCSHGNWWEEVYV